MKSKVDVLGLVEVLLKLEFDDKDVKEVKSMLEFSPELLGLLKKRLMLAHEFIELIEQDAVLKGLRGKL